MSGTKIPEQRKHRRFEAPKAIAVNPDNICRVLNISTGGLSFQCFLTIDLPTKWSLDIINAGSNCQLTQFPVELVWKAPVDESNFLLIPEGNVGVKFDNLHQSQAETLDRFLSQL
jgi:hypothetical protein